jgi:hypothetical protein
MYNYINKLIIISILVIFCTGKVYSDSFGPLAADKESEKKSLFKNWSVELGQMNGNLKIKSTTTGSYTGFGYFGGFPNGFLINFIPITDTYNKAFTSPVVNFSYRYATNIYIDVGVTSIELPYSIANRTLVNYSTYTNTDIKNAELIGLSVNGLEAKSTPLLGGKYFLAQNNFNPFVSLHLGQLSYGKESEDTKTTINLVKLGLGSRYEISDTYYIDGVLSYYDFKSNGVLDYLATGYGLDIKVGYRFDSTK